jgi:hypothetical protein
MKKGLFSRRSLFVGMLVAGVLAVPAQAMASSSAPASLTISGDTSSCTTFGFSEPFLTWKDQNSYELIPGESVGSFDGTGWQLFGGATIVTTTLADGTTGQVLDLPAGSYAVSPVFCVQSNYPSARMMMRQVGKGPGVTFGTAFASRPDAQTGGQVNSSLDTWKLSNVLQLHQSNAAGWQPMQIGLVAGNQGEYQVYNLYVDPHMAK